jgi:hypothetical protein
MREAYAINVFRRNGVFFVSPSVGGALGFENLAGVIRASGPDELLNALEQARAQIEAAWARPKAERFPAGPLYYVAAGAKSWPDFLRGTVEVVLRSTSSATEISVLIPDRGFKRLESTENTPSTTHPADLPLRDVVPIMLGMFAQYPA